jgi:hypothetical protein
MNLAIFIDKITTLGLEAIGLHYSFYSALIIDNKDPEFRGRLKVRSEELDLQPEIWVNPINIPLAGKGYGSFWIPAINSNVYLMFKGGNLRFPFWMYGGYFQGESPEAAQKENPNNFLFQTPGGLRYELNDETEAITLTNKVGYYISITKTGIEIKKGDETKSLGGYLSEILLQLQKLTVPTPLGTSGIPTNTAEFVKLDKELKKLLQ